MSLIKSDMELKILDERATEYPDYPAPLFYDEASLGNAGFDLRAFFKEGDELVIAPNETVLVPTGLAIHIKNPDIAGMIIPRSGLGHKHGIVVGNLVGLIDSTYQGQYMVSCWNRSSEPYTLKIGDRLAQLIFVPVIKPTFNVVEEFTDETERGTGGFGSSGKN